MDCKCYNRKQCADKVWSRSNIIVTRKIIVMGDPFKDKLKNIGEFIRGTIAEIEKQAKDSALENDLQEVENCI